MLVHEQSWFPFKLPHLRYIQTAKEAAKGSVAKWVKWEWKKYLKLEILILGFTLGKLKQKVVTQNTTI